MAKGVEHDKATIFWVLPFAILMGSIFGFKKGVLSGICFLFGGLWLSPDLDTNSKAFKRWGILKFLWMPYKMLITHRSLFSHGPFIGTFIRICYLSGMLTFFLIIFSMISSENVYFSTEKLILIINNFPLEILSIIIGVEASAWLHLIKDKDPIPTEFLKRKKR